jgi:hypothetical protein
MLSSFNCCDVKGLKEGLLLSVVEVAKAAQELPSDSEVVDLALCLAGQEMIYATGRRNLLYRMTEFKAIVRDFGNEPSWMKSAFDMRLAQLAATRGPSSAKGEDMPYCRFPRSSEKYIIGLLPPPGCASRYATPSGLSS